MNIRTIAGEKIFLGIVLIVSFCFRMWMAQLVVQPFINDQRDYEWYAQKILRDPHGIASHSFRSYPMGLLTAGVYKVFGFGNHQSIFVVQALMDSTVAIMIYMAIRAGLGNIRAARIAAILYAFNPFTSGYVNVVLAEILTVWAIGAVLYTGVLFLRRPVILRGIVFGLALGLAAESRNAAFLWAAIPLGLLMYIRSVVHYKKAYAGIAIGLVLTVIYPLMANFRDFHEWNVTTVDSFYAKEIYNGAIIKRLPPLAPPLPQETYRMYAEYYTEYWPERQNKTYRNDMAKKYYAKAWKVISDDPWDYLRVRLDKMWYVWQKEALYVYVEPQFEAHRIYTYFLNLAILVLSVFGLFVLEGKTRDTKSSTWWMRWVIIGTLLYGTMAFSVTHAEHRLTVPFYPLLFVSAAVGISRLVESARALKRQTHL